jgi:hypothetical protein
MDRKIGLFLFGLLLVARASAGQVDGRQVIVSPDALREAEVAGSTNDALKVICVDGTCTGGGGGTQDVNLIEIGGVAVTTPLEVDCVAGCAGSSTGGTITETINALNDGVTLDLNGAAGAGITFTNNAAWVGTLGFFVSNDGGTTFLETEGVNVFTGQRFSRLSRLSSPDSNANTVVFQIEGGATHVRIHAVTFTSGSVDATVTATAVGTTMERSTAESGSILQSWTGIGAENGTSGQMVSVVSRNGDPNNGDQGLVVREMSAVAVPGSSVSGLSSYANVTAGRDPDDNLARTLELDDAAPAGTEHGLITRNIPSGTQDVSCVAGCAGSSFADNSAFAFGTTTIANIGFVFDDVAPNAVTENNAAAPRMSGNRVPYSTLRDAAGNERGANVTAANALVVDGSAVTQPVSAVNLDIRDLVFATDKVDASGSVVDIATFPDNEPINVAQWGGAATSLGQKTSANSVPVVLPSDQVVSVSTAATIGTATTLNVVNEAITITTDGQTGVGVRFFNNAAFSGTILFEYSWDGVTWVTTGGINNNYVPVFAHTGANGTFQILLPSVARQFRVRVSIYTSGTTDAIIVANTLDAGPKPGQAIYGSTTFTGGSSIIVPVGGLDELGTTNLVSIFASHPASGQNGLLVRPIKQFLTYNAPIACSVGVASGTCIALNANRKGLVGVNTSTATISCSVAQTAVLNSGVTLEPGAVWNMSEYSVAAGAINCIAGAAASNLSLQEMQ